MKQAHLFVFLTVCALLVGAGALTYRDIQEDREKERLAATPAGKVCARFGPTIGADHLAFEQYIREHHSTTKTLDDPSARRFMSKMEEVCPGVMKSYRRENAYFDKRREDEAQGTDISGGTTGSSESDAEACIQGMKSINEDEYLTELEKQKLLEGLYAEGTC